MDTFSSLFVVIILIALVIGAGVWIFVGIGLVGAMSLFFLKDYSLDRIGLLLQSSIWNGISSWELSAIPLFIWMGEILIRTDVTDRLFNGLAPWVERLPGRLLLTNVFGCALFAAVSGSSTATTAAIGKITIRELDRRGYPKSLVLGSLAGSGALGILIPPSIPMIVYGVAAEVSIAKLFVAGLLPGALLVGVYFLYIAIRASVNPHLVPSQGSSSWRQRFSALPALLPIGSLILVVMGSIYSGLATPSEAAAVGLAWSIVMALLARSLTPTILLQTMLSAVVQSCMICAILMGATFLSTSMGLLHVPQQIATAIGALNVSGYGLIVLLTIVYLILGCLLDGISIIVLTLPMVLPLIVATGFDPLWFGVYMVLVIEMAMVTPPVGFNLFVIKALTGEPLGRIAAYSFPFLLLMIAVTAIITVFPAIATWLPSVLL